MIQLNPQNFISNDLNSNSRLLVKNNQLYVETQKPNVFTRLWRFISHQYSNDHIVNQTIELGKQLLTESLDSEPSSTALRNIQIVQTKFKGTIEDLDTLKHNIARKKWENVIPEGETLDELKNETIYDLIDCSLPDALSDASILITLLNAKYTLTTPQVKLHDFLNECGILTPRDCIERGIAPELRDFKVYFDAHREELTASLLSRGFITLAQRGRRSSGE